MPLSFPIGNHTSFAHSVVSKVVSQVWFWIPRIAKLENSGGEIWLSCLYSTTVTATNVWIPSACVTFSRKIFALEVAVKWTVISGKVCFYSGITFPSGSVKERRDVPWTGGIQPRSRPTRIHSAEHRSQIEEHVDVWLRPVPMFGWTYVVCILCPAHRMHICAWWIRINELHKFLLQKKQNHHTLVAPKSNHDEELSNFGLVVVDRTEAWPILYSIVFCSNYIALSPSPIKLHPFVLEKWSYWSVQLIL